MQKVSIFIDGANLFFAEKKLGWKIDASKLVKCLESFGKISSAGFYSGEDKSSKSQKKFFDVLRCSGFKVETKPIKEIYNKERKETIRKANCDIEIVLDMVNDMDNYDVAILVSGDSDFLKVIEFLKSKGKDVVVISAKGTVASEIVSNPDITYIDFSVIKDKIELVKTIVTAEKREEGSYVADIA